MILSFHKIGENKETPRIWLESARLTNAGFSPGTPFEIQESSRRLVILRAPTAKRLVSHRKQAGTLRPIIELSSQSLGDTFPEIPQVKAKTSYGRIEISPSIRGFLIGKGRAKRDSFRVLEAFAGGGTLSEAIASHPAFHHVAGLEIEPAYADVWASKNPEALLVQADIRAIHPAELPHFDVLVAGIPCTSHSTMGRAKKNLKGKPEEGDTGDLFLHTLALAAHHMPAACVFENVPSFGTSLAGMLIKTSLTHLGYHICESTLEPHQEWGEPSDRRRWCLVATLQPGFILESPNIPFFGTLNEFLDPEMPEQDQADAARIANTITGLRAHNARHAALGHGFALTTINRDSIKSPTIPKSYHKINTGPFVETPYGPRLLRLHEVEKIMGANAGTQDYATGIQILGQGVQTRLWTKVFSQLGNFLQNPPTSQPAPKEPAVGQLNLI